METETHVGKRDEATNVQIKCFYFTERNGIRKHLDKINGVDL